MLGVIPLTFSLEAMSIAEPPILAEPEAAAPTPSVCGSCGATTNEHGELPCGH
jgi:hypothetical protein